MNQTISHDTAYPAKLKIPRDEEEELRLTTKNLKNLKNLTALRLTGVT